jgi:hypothetical protein
MSFSSRVVFVLTLVLLVVAVAVVVVVFFNVAALPQAARDKDAAAMSAIRNARNFLFFIWGSFLGGGFRSNLPRGLVLPSSILLGIGSFLQNNCMILALCDCYL